MNLEKYKIIRLKYNDKLIFKLSQYGYALNCDIIFSLRNKEIDNLTNYQLLNELNNGANIFIAVSEVKCDYNLLFDTINNKGIKVNFYLMDEPIINPKIIEFLLPISLHIFCNNYNYNHPQVHYMPIGIRDDISVANSGLLDFTHAFMLNEGLKEINKEYLCFLCFAYTHQDRNICYNELSNKDFILNLNKHPIENNHYNIFYNFLHKSHYTLCPRGCGIDTHRFFEAIYLNSIPIVIKSNTSFDKVYDIFPCLTINNWNEVTKEFLEEKLNENQQKLKDFHSKYPKAFFDINTIQNLLLQT
jgi:hypothetical protein